MNALERLGRAREALGSGRFNLALKALGPPLPRTLGTERRRLRGEALRGLGLIGPASRELLASLRGGPSGDPAGWCEAALSAAGCLRSLGRVREAGTLLGRARAVLARGGLSYLNGDLALEEAMLLRARGDWGPAVRALLGLRRASGRAPRLLAYLDWALGGASRFQGNLRESVRRFESSRREALRAGDRLGAGYAELGLGGTARVQGRLADSVRHYAAALAYFRRTEDLFGLAYARCGLANGLRQSGRWAEAERLYIEAGKLYRRLEDPADLGYVEWGLAQVLARTGRPERARRLIQAALRRFTGAGEVRGVVLSLLSLSALDHARGRTRAAEDLHRRALSLARAARIHTHLEIYT